MPTPGFPPTVESSMPPNQNTPVLVTQPTLTTTTTALQNTPSLTAPPPSATPRIEICSPLAGYALEILPDLVSNPFSPPAFGSDNPHQGVDLAVIDPITRIALEGNPVYAVLGGTVSGVILDRFPYGNALMVETRLDDLPQSWWETLSLPTPAPTQLSHPILTCPTPAAPFTWSANSRSLYIIYAHLQQPPLVTTGESLTCGDQIGLIGMSGNALNPHLHLEARIGPSGATFESMAHYTGNASYDEQRNYCLWRVSGIFQLLDPMNLLQPNP
jgi:murein DD-endopeptidase MepM/ murein hydrolase activator NlpD